MTPLIIGGPLAIVAEAQRSRLGPGQYVGVYIRTCHEAFRGREPKDTEIVYVAGADLVLQQPGVRGAISSLVGLGARERVA